MTNWNDARLLDMICYDLILADWPRGQNRKEIANLANGVPPFTDQEVQENQINVNVNDLSMARSLQEARMQFANGFQKPGNFFTLRTDIGPAHKRQSWGTKLTNLINKPMKRSVPYFEAQRSKFGLLVLHGISPAVWENPDRWRTKALGVDDVLIPGGTNLGFENLPQIVLRRSFTAMELQALTAKHVRDKGWNMKMVNNCLKWADDQAGTLMSTQWPDAWAPEKWAERVKEGGYYASDQVPVINVFDIYMHVEDGKRCGWVRRMILDSWGTPTASGASAYSLNRNSDKKDFAPGKGDFLYTSGEETVADSWQNIISFQFADLSAVAPFKYHSVRSLGFLLYAICVLQNRLHCKFNEAVFETLMMLFRVKSMDDVQRALKLNMVNKGFLDESITPVPAAERWQVNTGLVELGLGRNQAQIQASTGAYAQKRQFNQDNVEKTRFQVMAEVNADTSMIGAMLAQAYQYQTFEDEEIVRRFFRKDTKDKDCMAFRAGALAYGIPEKYIVPEAWEVVHERVMGGGNKTLEMQIAQQLMEWRTMFDPEPQRIILRDAVLAITDDPGRANALVPENPMKVTDSVHDAQLATGTLLQGLPVSIKTGMNHLEYVQTLLTNLAILLKQIKANGSMATPDQLKGMQNLGAHIAGHLQQLAQDKSQKEIVRPLADALGKLMNEVKGLGQRLQMAMKKQAEQNGNGQIDPKDKAKAEAMIIQAKTKSEIAKSSHAEKTAQRRITFEQKTEQDRAKTKAEIAKIDLTTAAELHRGKFKAAQEEE